MNGTDGKSGTSGSETRDEPTLIDHVPESIVLGGKILFGSWKGIPTLANLLDVKHPYHYPIPLFLKRLRLKEWRAVEAGDSEWFFMAVAYDAKFLSMISIDLWDKIRKQKFSFRHVFLGSRFSFSRNLFPSIVEARSGRDSLSIAVDAGARRLSLKASKLPARKSDGKEFDLDVEIPLSEDEASSFSVCLPFGLNRAMYSTKALSSLSGVLAYGGKTHRFDPNASVAALDDHKGFYPYQLHYDWVTGFGIDENGKRVGFNLTDNQVRDRAKYNENRLWRGGEIFALPPIKITRPYGSDSPWIIQDLEGMVDLVFTPEVPHAITIKLGIVDIDYLGPFGKFEGSIKTPTGEKIDAGALYGMGEEKSVRL